MEPIWMGHELHQLWHFTHFGWGDTSLCSPLPRDKHEIWAMNGKLRASTSTSVKQVYLSNKASRRFILWHREWMNSIYIELIVHWIQTSPCMLSIVVHTVWDWYQASKWMGIKHQNGVNTLGDSSTVSKVKSLMAYTILYDICLCTVSS